MKPKPLLHLLSLLWLCSSSLTAADYAAFKCGQANLRVVPSDRALEPDGLAGLKVLVLGEVRYLEPERNGRNQRQTYWYLAVPMTAAR